MGNKVACGGIMQVGDLIYHQRDDKYAIFLNADGYADWITVLTGDGTICQVIGIFWEVVCK
jgi:hypothetical protein